MYRTVKGSIPALPTETFFRPQKTNKRHIQHKDFPRPCILKFRTTTNNTRYFIVPTAHTEQFKNSFFVKKKDKTIIDWNPLNESQVQAETITDFSCLIYDSNTQSHAHTPPSYMIANIGSLRHSGSDTKFSKIRRYFS